MDFLSELSEIIDINDFSLENKNNADGPNFLVENKIQGGAGSAKPYLKITRGYFQKLLAELEQILVHLDNIKKAGEEYAAKKTPASIQKAAKAVQSIQAVLENNIYRYGQYGHDYPNPLYDFVLITGENMDQREFLRLGTAGSNSSEAEKISAAGLRLAEIDITKAMTEWQPILAENARLVSMEKEKVKTYLRRLDYIEAYQKVTAKGEDYYSLKEKVYQADTIFLQRTLLKQSGQYMNLAIQLLQEIKSTAEKNLKQLPDETARMNLAFHASQLIDELNRLASHSHFNGMTLFTGYLERENPNGYQMNLLNGPDVNQTESVYLPSLTSLALVLPKGSENPYEWQAYEALASEKETRELIQRLDLSIQKIQEYDREMGTFLEKLPAKAPYSDPAMDAALAKKISSTLAKYKLQNKYAYTAKPEQSINTQSTVLLLILKNAHDDIYNKLLKMRDLAVVSGNSIYNDQDREKFNKSFVSLLKEIDKIALQTAYNGDYLLTPGSSYFKEGDIRLKIVLDQGGELQKELVLFALDIQSLGLSRSAGYTIEITSPDQANMAIGTIDWALSAVNRNRALISSCLQSAAIGEYKDNLLNEYAKILPDPKAKIDYIAGRMACIRKLYQYTLEVGQKMQMWAWSGASGIYTNEDRCIIKLLFINLLADFNSLLSGTQNLTEALLKEAKLGEKDKQELSALNDSLRRSLQQSGKLRQEIGNQEFMLTGDSAVFLFEMTKQLLQKK